MAQGAPRHGLYKRTAIRIIHEPSDQPSRFHLSALRYNGRPRNDDLPRRFRVFRRFLMILMICVAAFAFAAPALAGSHVVAQKTSKSLQGTVFLSLGLTSGHIYRIDVRAKGHQPFVGNAIEHYITVYKGQLLTGSKSLALNGTAPKSFTATQPRNSKLSSWLMALSVHLKSGRNLNVRLVDLGRKGS